MSEPTEYSMEDLGRFTNNFSDKVSGDLSGTAYYRGRIIDSHIPSQQILVKVSNYSDVTALKALEWERYFFKMCQHKNSAELISFAADLPNGRYCLVFPRYQNSILEERLRDLEWRETVKILKGIASFLKHIHTNFNPRIVHSGIQPGNIFLDIKYNPKISNFEAATEGQPRNGTRRSIGYIDPYAMAQTEPTVDIYSFGIIMLQLITKEPCISNQNEHISTVVQRRLEVINRVRHAGLEAVIRAVEESLEANNHLVHESLLRTGCKTKNAKLITTVALKCIRPNTEDRPTADVLVDMLDDLDAKFPKVNRVLGKIKCFSG